jgi:protein tyrosine phosphatase (PTP) superfamily phosphohydrolase (DUF442 family)
MSVTEEIDIPVFEKYSRSGRIAKAKAARERRHGQKDIAKLREDKETKEHQDRFKAKKLMYKQKRKLSEKGLHNSSPLI